MHYTSREIYEFISRQTNDPIVERKTCVISGQPFAIFQSDLNFYEKISPTFNGVKFAIPTPTLCPEERQRRRLSFRNERKLYRRQCDASKKSIISIYSPDKPYKVYDQKIRRSDSRDPMDYGMDFDFSKKFTDQFKSLLSSVPHCALTSLESENADYTNFALNMKNCYMVFGGGRNEDCMYSYMISDSNNTIDGLSVFNSEKTYECCQTKRCFGCTYVMDSYDCSNCLYIEECSGCSDCIMCAGINNKQYYFMNQYVGKEKILELRGNIDKLTLNYYTHYETLKKENAKVASHIINSPQSSGEVINDSHHCIYSFQINNCDTCKYVSYLHNAEGSCDIDYASPYGANNSYNLCSSTGTCNSLSTFLCRKNYNIYYSMFCFDSSHLFGCIGLRNKSYCIFNKQYTKQDYEIMVGRIVEHMIETKERGEFFHPSLSPFGYNETVAQEHFPLERGKDGKIESKKDLSIPSSLHLPFSELGYKRSDYNADPSLPEGIQTIEKKNYTDEQRDALLSQDNLETQVFLCSISGRPYRLQKAEIEFYRKHHLPIPDKHPDVRHEERMKLRPGRTLFLRTCDCCHKEMLSVYSQGHEGKIYCEECYQQEMYS